MIESGSHLPGISAEDFGLPDHTALRWERPAEALRAYVPSYAVLDWALNKRSDVVEWNLPSWARIGIGINRAPVEFTVRNRRYDPLISAGLLGVTSRAVSVRSKGGVTIAIDVSPLGWSRLFSASAETYRDRIIPLDAVMRPTLVRELTRLLARSDCAFDVKPVLDAFLAPLLMKPQRDDVAIAKFMALVADTETVDLAAAAATLGFAPHTLRRLSQRYFGFPPKAMIIRTRFVRAMMTLLEGGRDADYGAIPHGYHDLSHFRRDANRFLGATPRAYAARPTPYMNASWRARRLVIGAPIPLLDPFSAS